MSNPIFKDNGDGTYVQETDAAFDPIATQDQITALESQITSLQEQAAANADLASRNAIASFQPDIDAANAEITSLQALLDAFHTQIPNPS